MINEKKETLIRKKKRKFLERLFRVISKVGKIPNFEVPTFLGNLNLGYLIDWINELEEYFEYEDI